MQISSCAEKGKRDYMEDRYKVVNMTDGRLGIVLCDGHGGYKCAEFVSKRLAKLLKTHKKWQLDRLAVQVAEEWDRQCLAVLRLKEFPKTVEERRKAFESKYAEPYMQAGLGSGTTLVCCILGDGEGQYVNIGDSRLVWRDGNGRVRGTRDHVPKAKDLGPLGGSILQESGDVARINGDLAVGRAIGDNTPELMGSVKDVPTSNRFKWSGDLKLLLASDGLFEAFSSSHAMTFDTACEAVEAALEKSSDNVTCVMVSEMVGKIGRLSLKDATSPKGDDKNKNEEKKVDG